MSRIRPVLALSAMLLLAASAARADGFIVITDHPVVLPPRPPPIRPPHFTFAPLEVVYHRVSVQVDDLVATVKIDQEFYNPNPQVLEGTYLFPLPEGARIDRFAMDVEGTMTEAELLPADKARAIYEDIVRRQKDPALLEYVGRGAFKARVFPIEPRKGKRIQIEYTQLLKAEGGLLEFVYPLNTEKFSAKPLKEVSVKVVVNSNIPIRSVYCPSHPIEIIRDGEKRVVAGYEASQVRPDTDFRLMIVRDERPGALQALFHRESGEGFFMLLASAPAPAEGAPQPAKDICFVLDTSGSMAGGKLDQARKALRFCLDNLNDSDRFEIIRFSTEAESLFGGLRPVDPESRAQAAAFIEGFRPIGGTAIADALRKAMDAGKDRLAEAGAPLPPYVVVFLTDGQPTIGEANEDKLAAIPVETAGGQQVRVFSFGIGNDVNTHFLDMVAKNTNASSQYVSPSEDLELKLSYFYSRIKDPALTGLSLSVDNPDVRLGEMWPPQLPDLYRHDVLAVFGRYTIQGQTGAAGALALAGTADGMEQVLRAEVVFPAREDGHAYIPRLWATRRVAWLLDEIRLRGESAELRDEITQLARTYGIVTPYTSYLILEDEARRNVPLARQTLGDLRGDRAAVDGVRREFADLAAAGRGPGAARVGARAVDVAQAPMSAASGNAQVMRRRELRQNGMDDTARLMARAEAEALAAGDLMAFAANAPAAMERAVPGRPPVLAGPALGMPRSSMAQSVLAAQARRADMGYHEERQANYATQARVVNNRAFYQNASRWVDIQVQGRAEWPTQTVAFASDAYFALLDQHPEARPWLALGDDLDIVLGGQLFQIRP